MNRRQFIAGLLASVAGTGPLGDGIDIIGRDSVVRLWEIEWKPYDSRAVIPDIQWMFEQSEEVA